MIAREFKGVLTKVGSATGAQALGILRVWRKCRVRCSFIYIARGPSYFYCRYFMSHRALLWLKAQECV